MHIKFLKRSNCQTRVLGETHVCRVHACVWRRGTGDKTDEEVILIESEIENFYFAHCVRRKLAN